MNITEEISRRPAARRRSFLWLLIVPFAAAAAPVTVVQEDLTYDVNADGSFTVEDFARIRVNDEQGAKGIGQVPLLYSESLDKLELLEAYTLTKDGKRLDVAADKVFVQELPVAAGAPSFSDNKLKIVVFPQVEPGSVLTLHIRRARKQPELPGVFSLRQVFSKATEIEASQLIVRAPKSLALHVSAEGVTGGEQKTRNADQREWRWKLQPSAAITPEQGSVDIADVSPYVVATNLGNYEALGAAYAKSAAPKSAVTPAIRAQAEQLTKNLTGDRAQAEALYRWVAANIRYVAIFLNIGGYVPHSADEVLSARYGDCKDHVALLEALLAARGIASAPVIVNAANAYKVPEAVAIGAFNHVITYIPSLDVYVDSTTGGFAPFGVLNPTLAGKTAIVASVDKSARVVLPLEKGESSVVVKREVAVAADGSASGKSSVTTRGAMELAHRAVLGRIPKEQIPQAVSALLGSSGQTGTASFSFSDPRDVARPFNFESQYQITGFARLPGPGAMGTRPGIGSPPPLDLSNLAQSLALADRKLPFMCNGLQYEEIVALTLPASAKVATPPQPVTATSKFGTYEASYQQAGQIVTARRALRLQFAKPFCGAEDYPELQKLGNAIREDLRAQVLLQ